jgi:hypothetical protein
MPTKRLPQHANIDHLKYQARDLLSAYAARDPQAAQRIREFLPKFSKLPDAAIFDTSLKLTDAQLMIAREYGFQSWARLRQHLEKPADRTLPLEFGQAVALIDAGDTEGLRVLLKKHPTLTQQHVTFEGTNYFRNPTLLEFTAENPIRNGTLPANIVEVAEILIAAGAPLPAIHETLGLVCSGRVPRECGVQVPMIELLCDAGAEPNMGMLPGLTHGEFEAVRALLRLGAALTLPVAAAIGYTANAWRLLEKSSEEDRRLALAFAAQFGRLHIVRLLLDAGVDPSGYNPVGAHSHSTPLHQAALAGHFDVVRLLVERGARLDLKDTVFQGTPLGWAQHAGNKEIEEYLLTRA